MRQLPVLMLLLCSCVTAPKPDATGSTLAEYLRRAEAFGFDGQVLVEKEGRVLIRGAYGFADRDTGRRTTLGTTYGIASQTKQFTAAAILKLEAEGKLRTDDPIGKFIDGVPADKQDMTIDQLLSHTSGLRPGDVVDDFARIDQSELIRRVLLQERRNAGTWQYSNANYNLLAAIVERASGMRYDAYLRSAIFAPAGMRHTGVIGADRASRGAVAYRGLIGQGSHSDWPRNLRSWGGGDVYSTVDDLFAWELALRKLDTEKLFAPRVRVENDDQYAYGWFVGRTSRGTALIEHGGDTEAGFNCAYKRFPDEHATILILSNRTEVNGTWLRWLVQEGIESILFGGEPPPLPDVVRGSLPAAGTYSAPDGSRIDVRVLGAEAIVSARDPGAAELLFGVAADSASIAKANTKARAMLDRLVRGETREAFAQALTTEGAAVLDEYVAEYQSLLDRHGALLSYALAGSVPRRNTAKSFVTLHFERGVVPIVYAWREKGEGRLGGSAVGDGPPLARIFAPVGKGALAAVNLGTGETITMRIGAGSVVIAGKEFSRIGRGGRSAR